MTPKQDETNAAKNEPLTTPEQRVEFSKKFRPTQGHGEAYAAAEAGRRNEQVLDEQARGH